MSVTAFIGAGAALGIGGPTTTVLTNAIKLRQQWNGTPSSNATVPAIQGIADTLDSYFAPERSNFEDIFHAIESLISLKTGLRPHTAKEFKPAIGAFITSSTANNYSNIILNEASDDIIDEIASQIIRYVDGFQPSTNHRWFADFWRNATAACQWDIGTLNYDNCIEQSLPANSWVDGFSQQVATNIYRFSPGLIVNALQTRILHLHGSVFFGHPHPTVYNRFAFGDENEDLYRFASTVEARLYWSGRSQNHAQSGELARAGAIITGQRKTDKLLAYPYSTYQTVLHNAILSNPRLLIVGYGFGDLHFNRLLSRLTRIHGPNRRVVLIDYIPENKRGENWAPEADFRDWPGIQTIQGLIRLSGQDHPLRGSYVNPWVSHNGLCKVYLEGFEEAVQNHGDEIIDFLTS